MLLGVRVSSAGQCHAQPCVCVVSWRGLIQWCEAAAEYATLMRHARVTPVYESVTLISTMTSGVALHCRKCCNGTGGDMEPENHTLGDNWGACEQQSRDRKVHSEGPNPMVTTMCCKP